MNWKKVICIAAAISSCATCAGVEAETIPQEQQAISNQQLADAEMMALLWMRTAAEYRALCYQAYNAALAQVDKAIADKKRKKKPLAIVLDCDETVTDNTAAMALSTAEGNGAFTPLWWRNSVHAEISEAMPGALDFLRAVEKRGVAIFYVTNRYSAMNYEQTMNNLKALNFPSVDAKHVLMMDDLKVSDKQPRFDKIAKKYDVVVYMGDNVGDFPLKTKGKSLDERSDIIDSAKKDFGTRYIIFPNPAYGSWVSALSKDYLTMTPNQRAQFFKEFLSKGISAETKQKYDNEKNKPL
ncbi:MAG: 5'-nucleotidase, lipoprotein e(P4) family [Selenomonadaceae bacterium]|nr:5'-nucleotidase, lipoprotein e(P4) family [Selenomonadaceae bacterium]